MNKKSIGEFIAKEYFFINIGKLIMRKILSYSVKFFFHVDLLSLKTIKENFDIISKKDIYFIAPGKSLDDFTSEDKLDSVYIGISKVISHPINCDFYLTELRFYNLIKYTKETIKKIKYFKPQAFIIKSYCSPTTILPSLIFIIFLKLNSIKVLLISEIYISDTHKNPKNKSFFVKSFFSNLDSFILLGRTYWDLSFLEKYFGKKFNFIGFDKNLEYAKACRWEGQKHNHTFKF